MPLLSPSLPLSFSLSPSLLHPSLDPSWGLSFPATGVALLRHYDDISTVRYYWANISSYIDWLTSVGEENLCQMARFLSLSLSHTYAHTHTHTHSISLPFTYLPSPYPSIPPSLPLTLPHSLSQFYHYGDWVPPPPYPQTNSSLVSAYALTKTLLFGLEMATAVADVDAVLTWTASLRRVRERFHECFFDSVTGACVCGVCAWVCLCVLCVLSVFGLSYVFNFFTDKYLSYPWTLPPLLLRWIRRRFAGSKCVSDGERWRPVFAAQSNNPTHRK